MPALAPVSAAAIKGVIVAPAVKTPLTPKPIAPISYKAFGILICYFQPYGFKIKSLISCSNSGVIFYKFF